MAKATYRIIEVVMFGDILCKHQVGQTHKVRLFPNGKAQVENPYGGVFNMAKVSQKNNLVFEAMRRAGKDVSYLYSIIVEGRKGYFRTSENLLK